MGPKIAFYWELLYKKLPIGGLVYMALYGIESRLLYPALACFGPKSDFRLGLQGNPIELPLVMDTAA